MDFSEFLLSLNDLIELPIQSLSDEHKSFIITEVDFSQKKYLIKTNGLNRLSVRTFKDLETVFNELIKTGFCSITQLVKGSKISQEQIGSIYANLPFISYFNYENSTYIVLEDNKNRSYGCPKELSVVDQKNYRRVINNLRNLDFNSLANNLDDNISSLKLEVEKIHTLSPGLLADTNMQELIKNFESFSKIINATTIKRHLKINNNKSIATEGYSEEIERNDFDMADLVDMPYVTGIDEGKDYEKTSLEDDDDAELEILNEIDIPSIRRQTPSFSLLYDRLLYNEIEIQPDYQRKDRIWSDDKKSKLIESILMGLPLPIFYFGERKNDDWVVIDGLQRLTTIQDFMQNKFPLKLESNSSVAEANNQFFKDFNRNNVRAIREFEITAYVIDIEDPKSSKFITELFHRINTYGVKLSDQEIRSAIHFGASVFYLKHLASSKTFTSATSNTVNPKRQKDLELCLGALSFMLQGYKRFRHNRFDDFLTHSMKFINSQSTKKVNKDNVTSFITESRIMHTLTQKFEMSLRFCSEIFGKDAFKKVKNSNRKDPISKPLFETLVCVFSNISDAQKNTIKENKEIFRDTLFKAIADDENKYAIWTSQSFSETKRGLNYAISNSTGKRVTILYRFDAILQIIKQTTNCDIEINPFMEDA